MCIADTHCVAIHVHKQPWGGKSCFRSTGLVLEACANDKEWSVFERIDPYLSPPPSTPPPPPVPIGLANVSDPWASSKHGTTAAELNLRFREGSNSGYDLFTSGILVHQFDFMSDSNPLGTPWLPGTGTMKWDDFGDYTTSTWPTGDRISATIINGQMTLEPASFWSGGVAGMLPIYSRGLSGLILSPRHNSLLCAHAYDADSVFRVQPARQVRLLHTRMPHRRAAALPAAPAPTRCKNDLRRARQPCMVR